MSRYSTRGFPPPPPDDSADIAPDRRVFKEQVSVGTPLRIRGDAELRRDIENSLEELAKKRLLEAEENANILMAQARKGAADVLEKAANQVQDMLSRVQAQVDGIRENSQEEGFKAGFQEGYEEGLAQASAEAVVMLQSAHTLMNAAWRAQKRTLEDFETQTLALLGHLGRKILGQELRHSPENMMRLLRQAVESLYISGKTQVVVNPEVLHSLREFDLATRNALENAQRFEFIADPALEPGQVYIIAQEGCFDLSPDTQTDRLLGAIAPHLRLPRPSEEALANEFSREEPPFPALDLPSEWGGEADSGLIPPLPTLPLQGGGEVDLPDAWEGEADSGFTLEEAPPLPTLPLQGGGEVESGFIPEERFLEEEEMLDSDFSLEEEDEAGLKPPQEPEEEELHPFAEDA